MTEPWGFLLRISVYIEGGLPSDDLAPVDAANAAADSLERDGATVHRTGVYIEDVPEKPSER